MLLGSFGIGALPMLVDGDVSKLRVAYVPTAAGPDAESQFWVKADREQLRRLGCQTVTLDLAQASPDVVERELGAVEAVFVTGGDVYDLLREAHRSGFFDVVPTLVENGSLIYIGTSAGAMFAGPDVARPSSPLEAPDLDSTTGLCLVHFSVLPHDDHPNRRKLNEDIVRRYPEHDFIVLRDEQAVVVRGSSSNVVPSRLLASVDA
jgi:dipeptidase E